MWKLNIPFHFFSFRRDWLLIANYISLVMCKFSKNICWTFARRFPLFMTIKFLLLRTYASFCYRWSYLPKFALSSRSMLQKWKPEELSRANLENATFANLFSSRVFKYYIIYKCGIYQFCSKFTPQCSHFCNIFALSKFYLCKYLFFVQC